ncbi:MAG: hypothetical protein SFT90_07320 [Rickettsiales bacterium]|nr:hypothetical protein [Rickettsiales bacterium]
MSDISPYKLSPDERAIEVAAIFSKAFLRLKEREKASNKSANNHSHSTGLESGSKHVLDTNFMEKPHAK